MEKFLRVFLLFNISIVEVLSFCSIDTDSIATYNEIKDLPNKPDVLLIDVRTLDEVNNTGRIPTSIHIPIAVLNETLSLKTDAEKGVFYQKHGRIFPRVDDQLIFYCLLGKRAKQAMEIACSLGFNKSKFYQGSWREWAEKEGLDSNIL